MNILLVLQSINLLSFVLEWTVEANVSSLKLLRTLKILRLLPGSAFDVIVRAIILNVMYCCYRKSKKMRLATVVVWLICSVLVFLGTLFHQLYWIPKETEEYKEEVDALIATKEEEGDESAAKELLSEKE